MSSKKAIVTGATGQVASYLIEHLLADNYKVYGTIRRSSTINTQRIDHLYSNPDLELVYSDLLDSSNMTSLVGDIKPDFFWNLAAQSHVRVSFDIPIHTSEVTGVGVVSCLEAIRKASPKTRFYQASSSEIFGSTPPPQNENTFMHPRSPYAVAKLMGYWITINYREAYNIFASNGIVFNTESPRRGETFVTRKITRALGRIKYGLQDKLELGNLDAKRDWSHARDSSMAMKMILEHDAPGDFCIGTGKSYSVRDFLDKAGEVIGIDWKEYVTINPRYYRATEVDHLQCDPTKAMTTLGWKPTVSFDELVKEMVEHDLNKAKIEALVRDAG